MLSRLYPIPKLRHTAVSLTSTLIPPMPTVIASAATFAEIDSGIESFVNDFGGVDGGKSPEKLSTPGISVQTGRNLVCLRCLPGIVKSCFSGFALELWCGILDCDARDFPLALSVFLVPIALRENATGDK